jgi:hypothetical protein
MVLGLSKQIKTSFTLDFEIEMGFSLVMSLSLMISKLSYFVLPSSLNEQTRPFSNYLTVSQKLQTWSNRIIFLAYPCP